MDKKGNTVKKLEWRRPSDVIEVGRGQGVLRLWDGSRRGVVGGIPAGTVLGP